MSDASVRPAIAERVPVRVRRVWSSGVLVVATLASLLVFHQLWADPTHLTLGGPGHINDPMQTMWNLKWVPWQLLHGHNPFSTHAIYYPRGVSLSWNTLTPTLGVLAAPLTLSIGPEFAYAVLMTLAPALGALTGFWWLRRHTASRTGAALGGLVIGFNPFMTGHLLGHLNLVFVALVPIMLMLFEDLLWRRPRPNGRTAAYLGLVTAAQAGISEELILITAMAVAIALALACAALVFGHRVWSLVRPAGPAMLGAVTVFVLVSAPLLVSQLFLSAPVELHSAHWRATLGDYVLPLHGQLVDPNWPHTTYLGGAEDGVYVGVALIALLVVGIAVTARRDRAVRVAAATLAVLVVFTFGASRPLGIPLPWQALSHLPVLTSILPARFSFAAYLVIAWLLARWLDALVSRARSGAAPVALAAMAAVAVAVVTIVPYQVGAGAVPPDVSFFTARETRTLFGTGAPVLLLPSPTFNDASGMYYQMQADFSFDQPGGYALRPDDGHAAYGPPNSPLVQLAAAAPSRERARDLPAGRRQLAAEHYRGIVVVRGSPATANFIRLAEQLTGRRADLVTRGVEVWILRPPR